MKPRTILLAALAAMVLAGCAAGANPGVGLADSGGETAGFLLGLWQGFIAPITFFISLFTNDVSVYEVHNSGNWYDFGFVVGAGIIFQGSRFRPRRRK